MAEPLWLKAWVGWMMIMNSACLIFLKNREARWVLAAWIANIIFMTILAEQIGYVRLLGLSHVIFWTPLMVYLLLRRSTFDLSALYGRWLAILIATNCISLIIDYVDVARYFFGDKT